MTLLMMKMTVWVRCFLSLAMGAFFLLATPSMASAAGGYKLNSGDKLQIDVWKEEALKSDVVVLPDGTISFPLVGHLPAAGKSTEELVSLLEQRLSEFIPGPQVSVKVVEATGNIVYIIGEVQKPGEYVMVRPIDVMQALTMAGGLTPFAGKNDIHILRREANGKTTTLLFEYGDVQDGDDLETNVLLQSGDTIVVP
jgi:polysaccharide biosynthesis/export protein